MIIPDTFFCVALGGNLPFGSGSVGAPSVSVGSHLAATLGCALNEMSRNGFVIRAVSRFFATPCHPPGAGPDYVNAAAMVTSQLGAAEALARLHEIEARLGRTRSVRWGARTLDLDLIAARDLVLPDAATQDAWRGLPPEAQAQTTPETLILPHPRLQDRAFVLLPMADICPDWTHPRTGRSVTEMLAARPKAEIAAIRAL